LVEHRLCDATHRNSRPALKRRPFFSAGAVSRLTPRAAAASYIPNSTRYLSNLRGAAAIVAPHLLLTAAAAAR